MVVTDWTTNSIMWWYDADASAYRKVTDHGRAPLSIDVTRIETIDRMADGTLRRYTIAKKRKWSTSWDMIPSTNFVSTGYKTADGGMSGEEIEAFWEEYDDAFSMKIRAGDGSEEVVSVMMTDFSKEIVKRGIVDMWNIDLTLEEV